MYVGKFNGVQQLIKNHYPQALYVHCSAHSLNLVVSTSCAMPPIRNAMGTIESVYCYLNTPKRLHILKNEIFSLITDPKKVKLQQLCHTRWIQRHDSVLTFLELYPAIISSLEILSDDSDRETSSKASNLLISIQDFQFLTSLHIINKIFGISIFFCKVLQKTQIDLGEALTYATHLSSELKKIRDNADNEFKIIFNQILNLSEKYNITIKTPRLSKKQVHRNNIPCNDTETYYKIAIFIPFLDTFLQSIEDRFVNYKHIFTGFQCIINFENEININDVEKLTEFYKEDLEDIKQVYEEVKMWYSFLKTINKPNNILEYLDVCDSLIFPNVYKLIKILVTLPVTTCTAERSFSTLRRLKTYLRNTMSQNRLNGLALLNIHREITVTPEEVLNQITKTKKKLDLVI